MVIRHVGVGLTVSLAHTSGFPILRSKTGPISLACESAYLMRRLRPGRGGSSRLERRVGMPNINDRLGFQKADCPACGEAFDIAESSVSYRL